MNDQVRDKNILFTSCSLLDQLDYDGKLSQEDIKFLQVNQCGFDYSIKSDAEIIVKFYQSFNVVQLLTKMTARYDISLMYSDHIIKFKGCKFVEMKSLSHGDDVLVEAKFICEAKPGLRVEFEHTKIDD